MDLKTRARQLREQAAAATAEAQARWDELVTARNAFGGVDVPEGSAVTDLPEYATARTAQDAYDVAAEAARKLDDDYKAVLELMGDEAPKAQTRSPQPAAAGPEASIGSQFVDSPIFRDVSARIPETPGTKQAIGTTSGVTVANREQARKADTTPADPYDRKIPKGFYEDAEAA